MTARELIRDAMQEIGAIAAGESLSNADAQVGFVRLNSLLDLWQTERLTIATITRTLFSFVSGQSAYTIGPTALSPDIPYVVRPAYIESFACLHVATTPFETPVESLSKDQWMRERMKTLSSTYPTSCYYNRTFPLGTLTWMPVPTDNTVDGVLYIPQPLGPIANLNTEFSLAPGYEEALRYNLAVRLCAPFGRPQDSSVVQLATITKAQVKRTNTTLEELRVDAGLLDPSAGAFDLFTGGF